jgi:hypothetical protein
MIFNLHLMTVKQIQVKIEDTKKTITWHEENGQDDDQYQMDLESLEEELETR